MHVLKIQEDFFCQSSKFPEAKIHLQLAVSLQNDTIILLTMQT